MLHTHMGKGQISTALIFLGVFGEHKPNNSFFA